MEPLDAFEKLARRAREEAVPNVDVSSSVLARVRVRQETSVLPLWVYAGALTPVAAAMLVFAMHAWASMMLRAAEIQWAGPVTEYLTSSRLVIP